jgi:hypothetical protein
MNFGKMNFGKFCGEIAGSITFQRRGAPGNVQNPLKNTLILPGNIDVISPPPVRCVGQL